MKKKGFTLVELLAVIAILAILVIVAMPNVLGMFNQAKANSFVTEVQKYMDVAKTAFMTNAMYNSEDVVFVGDKFKPFTGTDADKKPAGKELDMDGGAKNYVIWFDRNGLFERVVVYDNNFCYDSHKSGVNKDKAVATPGDMDKSSVSVNDVWEHEDTDTLEFKSNNAADKNAAGVKGCAATSNAKVN